MDTLFANQLLKQEENQPDTRRGEDDNSSGINASGSQGIASSPVVEPRRLHENPGIRNQNGPNERMDPGLHQTQGSEGQANDVCRTPPLKREDNSSQMLFFCFF